MISVQLCCLLAILFTTASSQLKLERREDSNLPPATITQGTYKAAVLQHERPGGFRRYPMSVETREEALEEISPNLDVFERQAAIAGQQNVDILVFPLEGVYGGSYNIESLDSFLETVPDPRNVTWNPCLQPSTYNNTQIQHRLSCMARNNSLYIVANMAGKQPCPPIGYSYCPYEGYFTINTNVVYDPDGFLIARYRRNNMLDYLTNSFLPYEPTTFDTPFGRFALITSYDIFLGKPAVDLIKRYNVDSIAHPTSGHSFAPIVSAKQWQPAFATATKVNLLSASVRFHGYSGIYIPSGQIAYPKAFDTGAQLLIATIPARPVRFQHSIETPILTDVTSDTDVFEAEVFFDHYNFVKLQGANGTSTVCSGTFCCQAEFSRQVKGGELFVLGAFSGRHTAIVQTDLQVCALLKCPTNYTSSCSTRDWTYSQTQFTSLVLKGNFNTKYLFPEILLTRNYDNVYPGQEWSFSKNAILSDNGFSDPLMSAILIGRDYSRDYIGNFPDPGY